MLCGEWTKVFESLEDAVVDFIGWRDENFFVIVYSCWGVTSDLNINLRFESEPFLLPFPWTYRITRHRALRVKIEFRLTYLHKCVIFAYHQ